MARSPATAVAIVKETKTAHLGFSKVVLGVTVSMDLVVIVIYTLTALLCDTLVSNGSGNGHHFLHVVGVFTAQVWSLYACLSVCLPACLSVCLSVCISLSLSLSLSTNHRPRVGRCC